ncbi:hypothetical protein [Curtobacterium sp. UCD-KPL2560]|uniref:hypothetical protein n=1 Tax=Curtobacterium sp. UCD-KPL2560 TaxID=1885315 RepID=UPI0008245846|nr:hypothetical protein [Curtobacterium sp. UCD-KPL2560]
MSRKTIAIATAALSVVLLAGCSAGGPSKAEQCREFSKTVQDAASGVQSSAADLQSDPGAALDRLKELDDKIDQGVDELEDADLKEKGDAFSEAYGDMVDAIEDVSEDPGSADVSALTASSQKVQSTGSDFQKACTS